jgi:hypothetical protein
MTISLVSTLSIALSITIAGCILPPGARGLKSNTKNGEFETCYSDGYQPFNYNSRLKQSKPGWVMSAEETLARQFSASGVNLLPLLTGYRGTEKGLKEVSEISVKTCTKEESLKLSKNTKLLSSITDFLNNYQALSHPISTQELQIIFEADRKITVFSSLKSDGNVAFDKPTVQSPVPVDYATHHNQSLDAWQKATSLGLTPKQSLTVVHIDTHSDLYMYSETQLPVRHIADYLNFAASTSSEKNFQVEKIIWILPDTFPIGPPPSAGKPFHISRPTPYDTKFGSIQVTTARLSEVDFSKLPDGYFLDIDSDYFSNSGWDTRFQWGYNPSRQDLFLKLQGFSERVFGPQHRKPSIVTISTSPEFTPWEDFVEIKRYFSHVFTATDFIKNTVGSYHYHYNEGTDKFLKQEIAYLMGRASPCQFSQTLYDLLNIFGAEDSGAEYIGFCGKR